MRRRRHLHVAAVASVAALAAGVAGTAALGSPLPGASRPVPPAPVRSVLGITALSGLGSSFAPPARPSYKPSGQGCSSLLDPGFDGKCVVASGQQGTVAAVVESERGAFSTQERDLVWRRQRGRWQLSEVHVSYGPTAPARAWKAEVVREQGPGLVFVLGSRKPGFGRELDIVGETGRVVIVRFLDGGFAIAPGRDRLVTFTPAGQWWYQLLFGVSGGHWEVFSQQYVPYGAGLARHKGPFLAPGAVPAS